MKRKDVEQPSKDPLSDKREHPGGTAAGAAAAGAAGGAIGTAVAGPVGGIVGIAVGAVAGGMAGKAVAEKVNPTVEDAYWRENWSKRPYADASLGYEHYQPAYRHGWESRMMHGEREWDQIEADLEKSWAQRRGHSALDWARARLATRDAWDRLNGVSGGDPERKDH